MDDVVVGLLASRSPEQVRDFLLAWAEHRSSTWANASREALSRGASTGHVPQLRGQLRYHLGESAVAEASKAAGAGCLPMQTVSPGATFMVARLGRFALVNQVLRNRTHLPRRSVTRKLLSQPNAGIDPQGVLPFADRAAQEQTTELAYFGCLASVVCRSDPSVPAELAVAIPSRNLDRWIAWLPLNKAHELVQNLCATQPGPKQPAPVQIPDRAFSTFRMPKTGRETGDSEPER